MALKYEFSQDELLELVFFLCVGGEEGKENSGRGNGGVHFFLGGALEEV